MGYRQKHPYIAQIGYMLKYAVKRGIERLTWMFKVRDCRHVCLFCEYYETCRNDGGSQRGGKQK